MIPRVGQTSTGIWPCSHRFFASEEIIMSFARLTAVLFAVLIVALRASAGDNGPYRDAIDDGTARATDRQAEVRETLARTHAAWAAGDYAAVRAACKAIVSSSDAPAALRSYAHLRIAQSYVAEGKRDLARTE
jgi:hypothetical protein